MFILQSPEISGIWPEKGPKSGGTRVTIKGKDLRIGSAPREIYIGDGASKVECEE